MEVSGVWYGEKERRGVSTRTRVSWSASAARCHSSPVAITISPSHHVNANRTLQLYPISSCPFPRSALTYPIPQRNHYHYRPTVAYKLLLPRSPQPRYHLPLPPATTVLATTVLATTVLATTTCHYHFHCHFHCHPIRPSAHPHRHQPRSTVSYGSRSPWGVCWWWSVRWWGGRGRR